MANAENNHNADIDKLRIKSHCKSRHALKELNLEQEEGQTVTKPLHIENTTDEAIYWVRRYINWFRLGVIKKHRASWYAKGRSLKKILLKI